MVPFASSLRSKRFRASSSRTLGGEQKKEEWRGRGRGEKDSSSPLPLPFFFCSRSNFRAIGSTGNTCYAGYFASYISRGYSKPRLIFSRINGHNVSYIFLTLSVKLFPYNNLQILYQQGQIICMSHDGLRKQLTFRGAVTGFPTKRRRRNERRNSILMTCHYPTR